MTKLKVRPLKRTGITTRQTNVCGTKEQFLVQELELTAGFSTRDQRGPKNPGRNRFELLRTSGAVYYGAGFDGLGGTFLYE